MRTVQEKQCLDIHGGLCVLVFLFVVSVGVPCTVFSDTGGNQSFTENGVALNTGYTYDPSDGGRLFLLSVFKLYDYEGVWGHPAPDNLKFKVEGAIGSALTDGEEVRLVANAGFLALLYLDGLKSRTVRPYIEGGVGVIYTDYQVKGQDYRFNFNPQAGFGIEFDGENGRKKFVSIRAHHISNGGIGSDNRGQNTIVIALGRYF